MKSPCGKSHPLEGGAVWQGGAKCTQVPLPGQGNRRGSGAGAWGTSLGAWGPGAAAGPLLFHHLRQRRVTLLGADCITAVIRMNLIGHVACNAEGAAEHIGQEGRAMPVGQLFEAIGIW